MAYPNNAIKRKRRIRQTKAKRVRKRRVTKRENSTIYIGITCFILISIYLFGYVYQSLGRQTIALEEIKYGDIEVNNNYTGVVIRDEYIVTSPVEGNITYYYNEGERIKKDAIVCNVTNSKDSEVLQQKISDYDNQIMKMQANRSEISLFQFEDDINNRNDNIKNLLSNYISGTSNNRLNNLYSFKTQLEGEIDLRSRMLLGENGGSVNAIAEDKFKYEEELKKNINPLLSTMSGVVSFVIDTYEEVFSIKNMETLQPEQTTMKFTQLENITTENVTVNQPVFKIIHSDEWYIVAYISDEISNGWVVGDEKTLKFDTENSSLNFTIKNIIQSKGEKLVIFCANRNMLNFISTRSVNFQIESENYKGLKIPNSAIVNKTFLKIPMNCIIEDSEQTSIRKVQDEGDILMPIKISFKDETESYAFILQDFGSIKVNDKIVVNGAERVEYIISDVETLPGVYVVNKGIAELRSVEITISNDIYSIIKPDDNVTVYDMIASDAKSVVENQPVY